MRTQNSKLKTQNCCNGSILVLVVIAVVLLAVMGMGLLSVAYGVRLDAIRFKNEAVARLAAEAGYEKALYVMSKKQDMLSAIQKSDPDTFGNLTFPDSDCDYQIQLFSFAGSRPIYRIISTGHSGVFNRTTDVLVVQAISGWDMGKCKVASGSSNTTAVYFVNGEIIDIPLHINNLKDNPDNRDIYISGSPRFLQEVGMGESQYAGKTDKYASVMGLFEGGIDFGQPDCKITDETAIQSKVDRFKDSTKTQFKLTPSSPASITNKQQAVQLEFFVEGGVGKVRVTNNCAVRGVQQSSSNTWDWKITPGSGGTQYQQYYIYAYHVRSANADSTGERFVIPLEQTYVTQTIGGVTSEPGGQIFVNGNVIIGSGDPSLAGQDIVKGKVTVVATGNIWIADSVQVSDYDDSGALCPRGIDGMPSESNPNAMGLIAQSVVKVVDPGRTDPAYGNINPTAPSGYTYVPISVADAGQPADSRKRHLPEPTVIEAAITSGGGGWGAENVARGSNAGRKEASSPQDDLVVRGTITEALRGVVGVTGQDGYLKHYYLDERFLEGILPGDIWLRGKYIPAPAGWHDYRAAN